MPAVLVSKPLTMLWLLLAELEPNDVVVGGDVGDDAAFEECVVDADESTGICCGEEGRGVR